MTARPRLRVLLVDDHEIVREGLRALLGEEPEIEVVGEAADGPAALVLAAERAPDVVLLDLVMPGMDGIELLRRLRADGCAARALVLTTFADGDRLREALAAGASDYLLKDVSKTDLLSALRAAREGRPALHPEAQRLLIERVLEPERPPAIEPLTPREKAVLELLAEGLSNKQIGRRLHLSEGTVKGYVSVILGKLGVEDRTQAALKAVREGLVG